MATRQMGIDMNEEITSLSPSYVARKQAIQAESLYSGSLYLSLEVKYKTLVLDQSLIWTAETWF